jgi:hypothetical protein
MAGNSSGGSSGQRNTAVGAKAMQGAAATTASRNATLGDSVLLAITSGNDNLAAGSTAGTKVTSGGSNVLLGSNTASQITTGSNNTVLGGNVASTTLATGSGNILIGTSNAVDTAAGGTSNFLNIGNLVEGDLSIGHFVLNGTAPTIGSGSSDCGTTPAIAGNDNVGLVTVGSSTNGSKCTITFHTAWTTAPVCVALNQTTGNLLRPTAATGTLTLNGTLTAADKLSYMCKGYQL